MKVNERKKEVEKSGESNVNEQRRNIKEIQI
jgi:hypothetical protein